MTTSKKKKNAQKEPSEALQINSVVSEVAINQVSDRVRNHLVAYIGLVAYVLIAVLTTSDQKLLMASEGLDLPVISLQVPLVGFFVIVPIILVAFHLSLLHYKVLQERLIRSHAGSKVQNTNQTMSFIEAFAQSANAGALYYLVPLALAIILWRFADYQSPSIFCYHTFVLLIDVWLVGKARQAIFSSVLNLVNDSDRWVRSNQIMRIVRTTSGAFVYMAPRSSFYLSVWVAIALLIAMKVVVCWDVFIRDWPNSYTRYLVLEKDRFASDDGIVGDRLNLIPNLVIDRTVILYSIDERVMSRQAVLHGYTDWQDYFEDRGQSLDLRNRSLKFAYLHGQTLPRLWAQNASFQGANLSLALLSGSVLVGANLQNANLELTNLSGSYLNNANLREALIIGTDLRAAHLDQVEMQGAYIKFANFTGAWVPYSSLQLSMIYKSDFTGAYFEETKMWGALVSNEPMMVLSTTEAGVRKVTFDPPSSKEIAAWGIEGPIKNPSQLGEEKTELLLIENNQESVNGWVKSVCHSPLLSGDEAATKMLLKLYSVLNHPAHTIFSSELRKASECRDLLTAIGEDRKFIEPTQAAPVSEPSAPEATSPEPPVEKAVNLDQKSH